jgi:hypothetical protein
MVTTLLLRVKFNSAPFEVVASLNRVARKHGLAWSYDRTDEYIFAFDQRKGANEYVYTKRCHQAVSILRVFQEKSVMYGRTAWTFHTIGSARASTRT